MRQFRYFITMYGMIGDVPGDVVECGLGEGNTFAMLAYLIGSEDRQPLRKLWGFDSFEGWPEPTPYDASPRNPTKGEWRVSQRMVELRLKESKVLDEFPELEIETQKGFLSETLPDFSHHFSRRQIAFLHLDVDLYAGYRDGLQYLFPHVVPGGILLFDEYKEFPNTEEYGWGRIEKWPGCTKAVDDYFKEHPGQTIQYWPEIKKYFLIKMV
ncbi:MAG: TylF/MycF/NovP-related O-methyltransferase [Patescibacteria group bacterium]